MSMQPPPPPPPPGLPPEPWQPRQAGPSGPRAEFWPRFGAFLIDGVLIGVINRIVGAIAAPVVGLIIGLAVSIGYAVYFISSPSGQTLGMKVLNIRAVDAVTNGQVAPGKAFLRWLVSIASGVVCFLGYLWMLWDPEKQTWQDKVAGTYVVPTSYFPVEKWPG